MKGKVKDDMNEKVKRRQEDVLSKYPTINASFESHCEKRRVEIIDELLNFDENYQALTKQREDTSQSVLNFLRDNGMADLFEAYSDALYAEEVYELDIMYREAFLDAVEMLE